MVGLEFCSDGLKLMTPNGITEIVRGEEAGLLERLEPVVRQQSVELDLSGVERVDAAGLSALIRLYREACKAGHEFRVVHPQPHVREVLGLVGLDRLLFGEAGKCDPRFTATAA